MSTSECECLIGQRDCVRVKVSTMAARIICNFIVSHDRRLDQLVRACGFVSNRGAFYGEYDTCA